MKKKEKVKVEYMCYTSLVHRWNKALVEKFFSEPTKTVKNPYYSCAPKMKLYDIKQVERIEGYKRFIKMKEKVKRRVA